MMLSPKLEKSSLVMDDWEDLYSGLPDISDSSWRRRAYDSWVVQIPDWNQIVVDPVSQNHHNIESPCDLSLPKRVEDSSRATVSHGTPISNSSIVSASPLNALAIGPQLQINTTNQESFEAPNTMQEASNNPDLLQAQDFEDLISNIFDTYYDHVEEIEGGVGSESVQNNEPLANELKGSLTSGDTNYQLHQSTNEVEMEKNDTAAISEHHRSSNETEPVGATQTIDQAHELHGRDQNLQQLNRKRNRLELRDLAELYNYELVFLFEKSLTKSDTNRGQCRLTVPKHAVHQNFTPPLFKEEEIAGFRDGLEIPTFDESGEEYLMIFKNWHRSSGTYILQGKWKEFITKNQPVAETDGVSVWGFRKNDHICFMINIIH